MGTSNGSSRREFLARTSAVAGAMAAPYFIPAASLGANDQAPPSDRLVLGSIGTGGMGKFNLGVMLDQPDTQVVAVCDVDHQHRQEGVEQVNKKYGNSDCQSYGGFRELLVRDDIDAVVVATPDHWHALASIAAAKAGKDIYCEKPLANTVAEGRAICQAVAENDSILQTGSHERSTDNVRLACELIRNGRLGELHTIRIHMPCDQNHHREARRFRDDPSPMPVPEDFDYDMWLGHTAEVPYHEKRCHFWWRFNHTYGGGEMTDRGAHIIDLAQLALDTDDTGPVEFRAHGQRLDSPLYNAFLEFQFENTYANGVRMVGSNQGPRGIQFEGSEGWLLIHVHGGKLEAGPASILEPLTSRDGDIRLGRSPGHQRNFLDCVKSRETPMAPAEAGHRTATICHLNNIALQFGRRLRWDPDEERVRNHRQADQMLTPTMREPWSLG